MSRVSHNIRHELYSLLFVKTFDKTLLNLCKPLENHVTVYIRHASFIMRNTVVTAIH